MRSFFRHGMVRHGMGRGRLAIPIAVALLGGGAIYAAAPPRAATPAYLAAFPAFAPMVTPQMPGDVDIALKTRLEKAGRFAQVQREFDLYSWQMFFALNWPTDAQGKPAPRITDTAFGAPHWTLWHNSSDIFKDDGSRPAACGAQGARLMAASRDLSRAVSRGLKPFSAAALAGTDPRTTRALGVISAVGELNAARLSEIQQAFTAPLIDQNGEFVFYEMMIDPNETAYLCDTGLYNINGQVAFSQAGGKVVMPSGTPAQDWSGAFELKFAWRILKPGKDDFSRFYATPAVVMDQGPGGEQVERKVTVGLVGMHIGHKSSTSPQWIWSTFEQADNLDVDSIAHPNLAPSFTDPNCALCAVNQQPVADHNNVYRRVPTQAWRAIPIPDDKQDLNAQVSAAMRRAGSIWQYYRLIDTQWPTSPSTPPSPWNGGLPGAITNKSGGKPTPTFLTNITMETYFQSGNQSECNGEELPPGVACPQPWTSALNRGTKQTRPSGNMTAFMTESCTGCHSSAGIYTRYDPKSGAYAQSGQLTADFSWLLSQKAAYLQAR